MQYLSRVFSDNIRASFFLLSSAVPYRYCNSITAHNFSADVQILICRGV